MFKLGFVSCCYAIHKLGWTSIEKMYHSIFKHTLLGESSVDIKNLADKFIAENIETYLFQPVVKKMREAQVQGGYTVILSSSSCFLVDPIAKHLEVNEWGAVDYAQNDEKYYTAISSMMAGQDKANYISDLMDKHKVSKKDVIAYTDSYLDLPLLNAVGQPVCVNPDRKLHKIAVKNCWKVIIG